MNAWQAVLLLIGCAIVANCQKKGKENAFDVILEGHHGKSEAPGNFSVFVRNSTQVCIKARFTMTFDIEYFARKPIENRDYIELKKGSMPPIVSVVGGTCMKETDTPYMYLQWDHGYYTLNITFHTHRHETGDLWDIHEVEMIYDMNNTREFPFVAKAADRTKKRAMYVGHLFETPVGMSYECTGPTRITLTNEHDSYEVYLYMRHMQFQPTQIFDNQFSMAKPCKADLEPQGPVYSPHMHLMMAMVLGVAVLGMCAVYSLFKRYRTKLLPLPKMLFSALKSGATGSADVTKAKLFPAEPTYD